MENKNITVILDHLTDILQQYDGLQQIYLDSMHEQETAGAMMPADQLRSNEGKLPEFLKQIGIRSITFNGTASINTLMTTASYLAQEIGGYPGDYFRDASFTRYLQTILQHSSIIAFTDWALFANASDYWDALLTKVIKPLGQKEREFIFYLGNITDRPVFMVDEMLDIMGDFARHGSVTFIMDQQEMKRLWQALNGMNTARGDLWPFDHEEKYEALFQTMNVHRLVVYATNGVSLYSREEQFNLTRRVLPEQIEHHTHGRNDFINGYTLGLSLQLESALCITLGIVYYEFKTQYNMTPGRQELLSHIKGWKDQQDAITHQTSNR